MLSVFVTAKLITNTSQIRMRWSPRNQPLLDTDHDHDQQVIFEGELIIFSNVHAMQIVGED